MASARRSTQASNATRCRKSMADSATSEDQCHQKKLFIGGLAPTTTEQHIREHFMYYGALVDAVVPRWPDGRSRGFGYVTYMDVASANSALQDSHKIAGCDLDIKRAVPGTNKLFVGGLPQNATAAELRRHFESFGAVSDAVVMMDPKTNRSRGFGFICFLWGHGGAAAVAAALEQYDRHRIRGKWIEVKSAASSQKLTANGQGGALPSFEVSEDTTPTSAPGSAKRARQVKGAGKPHCPSGVPHAMAELSPPPGLEAAPRHIWWTGFEGKKNAKGSEQMPSGLIASAASPMKVHIGGDADLHVQKAGGAVFDASAELRRSLEQLLGLRAEQNDAPMACRAKGGAPQEVVRDFPAYVKESLASLKMEN